jgi:hypothetical protein
LTQPNSASAAGKATEVQSHQVMDESGKHTKLWNLSTVSPHPDDSGEEILGKLCILSGGNVGCSYKVVFLKP